LIDFRNSMQLRLPCCYLIFFLITIYYKRRSNEHRVYFQMCSLIRLYKFLISNYSSLLHQLPCRDYRVSLRLLGDKERLSLQQIQLGIISPSESEDNRVLPLAI
jgi:hypothetical protein